MKRYETSETASTSMRNLLATVPDLLLIQEAAKRLQRMFERDWRRPLRFGRVVFVFHEGQLTGIEEQPRNKRFFHSAPASATRTAAEVPHEPG